MSINIQTKKVFDEIAKLLDSNEKITIHFLRKDYPLADFENVWMTYFKHTGIQMTLGTNKLTVVKF